MPKDVRGHKIPISANFRPFSSKRAKVAYVAHDLAPLYKNET